METISKIPADAHALLFDIATIRKIVLENAPACLPLLAPALVSAEERIRSIWGC